MVESMNKDIEECGFHIIRNLLDERYMHDIVIRAESEYENCCHMATLILCERLGQDQKSGKFLKNSIRTKIS